MKFKPQLKIPATYMRGGRLFSDAKFFPEFIAVAAKKCDFSLLAGTFVPGGQSLGRGCTAFNPEKTGGCHV